MSVPALKPAGYPLKSIDREAFRDFLSNEIFERLDEESVEAIGAFEEEEGGIQPYLQYTGGSGIRRYI